MAEFPVGNDRDNLKLVPINQNGTISEMIQTIDENFKNIAAHGGGPDGLPGKDGVNGTDGTSAEYIFALCDEELVAGTHYPTTDSAKSDLFDSVEFTGSTPFPSSTNKKVEWFDHPQGVSKDHKNEYVFSRYKRTSGENIWFYAEKPELWAHWGETGKDGDGVEYIFMTSRTELDENTLKTIIKSKESMSGDQYQPVIYQMDDFFPGEEWFTGKNSAKNKANAQKAIIAKYGNLPSTFDTLWSNKFNMIVPGYNWTDDPVGTSYDTPYEYVAIRRCNVDDEDGKEWSDFSTPALWSSYGASTRTVIIYCNKAENTKPTEPQKGQGTWNEETSTLILPKVLTDAGWADTNIEPEANEITWMCSGIFETTGANVSWSKPMRITGKDGKQGEDGTTIQFIYKLSNTEPDYPNNDEGRKILFDNAEELGEYEGWMDHPLPINPEHHTEYVATRRRDGESNPWTYDEHPIIWAHWGEDGTDGDGVEYIFHLSTLKNFPDDALPVKVENMTGELGKYMKIVYNLDDFYPGNDWFDKTDKNDNTKFVNKDKAKNAVTKAALTDTSISVEYFESHWNDIKVALDKGWTDNPQGTSPLNPYEFVSIRRCDPDASTRTWGDFSDPAQWSYYGKATRTFVVYCNIPVNATTQNSKPNAPTGGWWNYGGDPELTISKTNNKPYQCNALKSGYPTGGNTPGDWTSHIGYWEDKNEDVDDTIVWSATGIFTEDGLNVSWSKPSRLTGTPGKPGEDGADIEYIYAVEDSMEEGKNYPFKSSTTYTWENLFDDVERLKSKSYTGTSGTTTTWYDNAQSIDKSHRTVFAWSRHKESGVDVEWTYDDAPFIWSHWGEDGKDGDGVEYIFLSSDHNTIRTNEIPFKGSELTDEVQKVIYNIDDFYPGPGWFNSTPTKNTKKLAEDALKEAGLYSASTFETDWNNKFGFTFVGGTNGPHWTDNPTGVSATNQYEFVSIRKSDYTTDGKKKWGDFSDPVLWSSYGKSTRTFMVYCNMVGDATPGDPTDGWWNTDGNQLYNSETDKTSYKKDVLTTEQRENIPSDIYTNTDKQNIGYWQDDDNDVHDTVTWVATGTFDESGDNLDWSSPHRITGAKGEKGADGSDIQFIYALSDDPQYPTGTNTTAVDNRNNLFNAVEDPDNITTYISGSGKYQTRNDVPASGAPQIYAIVSEKCVYYNGTEWFDRAQVISRVNKTEYCASRRMPKESTKWIPDDAPFVWAHWGEDGTDGDGIEYIFMLSDSAFSITRNNWNTYVDISNLGDYEKAIYSIGDFLPKESWFSDANKTKNEAKVRKVIEADGGTFDSTSYTSAWTSMKNKFSFDKNISGVHPKIGVWYDNPQDLTPEYQYQYVSVRQSPDGVWGEFSYPTLWSKYNITKFNSVVFTKSKNGVILDNETVSGGTFANPYPDPITKDGVTYNWSDSPESTNKNEVVWMTSATFKEDYPNAPYVAWSSPKKMTDTADFNVEWSSDDLTISQVTALNSMLNSSTYNFGTFLLQSSTESAAETAWRNAVKEGTTQLAGIGRPIEFDDQTAEAVLMATCSLSGGTWTNWVVSRVKGETGEAGRSINVTGKIAHEVILEDVLGDDVTYDYTNAGLAKDGATLKRAPQEGEILIVYPRNSNSDGIYEGDVNAGDALYMWKYVNRQWVDYNCKPNAETNPNGEDPGNTYESPNKHLILWDGDSWMDLGELVGPEGPAGKEWRILTRYANDNLNAQNQCKKSFVDGDDIPGARYVGFLTYEYIEGVDPYTFYNEDAYTWSLFKGQDGNGYEYIFWANNENVAPPVPTTTDAQDLQNDVKPDVTISSVRYRWSDDPIEPTKTNKYVWMCWRKYNTSLGKWDKFRGKDGNPSTQANAVARLWQVYARSISSVEEYFKTSTDINPIWTGDNSNPSYIDKTFWETKTVAMNSWNSTNRYLFNREVITYSDDDVEVLDPHFVAVYADGIKDVEDYYCLDGDGVAAPNYSKNETTGVVTIKTSGTSATEGTGWWTKNVKKTQISGENGHQYLWNITKKTYEDKSGSDNRVEWTTPYVIAIYNKGDNGDSAIYVDLDNEMDTVQIDNKFKVLNGGTYTAILQMFEGSEPLYMYSCQLNGEDNISDRITLQYSDSNSSDNWQTYSDGYGITTGIKKIKMTINLTGNNVTIPEYTKIKFIAKAQRDQNIIRETSYTLIGSTNPSVFSIVPSDNVIIEKTVDNNKVLEPSSLTFKIIKQTGNVREEKTQNENGEGGFVLKYTKNDVNEQDVPVSGGVYTLPTMSGSTPQFKSGDKLTFKVYVDSDDANTTVDMTMDTETIYVLREGEPGANGNGYRYYYARYVAASASSYGSNTIPTIATSTLSSDTPIFLLNNISLPASSNALGAEESYPYEYRVERYYNGTSWENWSSPITIAKYLTATNISTEVQHAVDNATTAINNNLTNAVNRLNTLEGYIDPSSGVFSGTVSDSTKAEILYGYATTSDVSSAISSINLGGLKVDASGTETFSEWYNSQNSTLTDVATRMSAAEGTLSTAVTTTQLSNVTTAFENYKADAHDQFAQMDRTVANANYLTDTEGYLLVNVPDYTVWFGSETYLNGTHKDPDERKTVEWVKFFGDLYDNDDPSTGQYEGNFETDITPINIPYDKLFNESKDRITFVLEEDTALQDISFISTSSVPTANSIEITYDIETEKYEITKNAQNFNLRVPYDNNGNPDYHSADGYNVIRLLYATCSLDSPKSKSGTKYIFSNFTWHAGVTSINDSTSYDMQGLFPRNLRTVYAKTGSIAETPIIPPYGESEILTGVDKYQQYGYILSRVTGTNYGVDNVTRNGTVSVLPAGGPENGPVVLPEINERTGEEWSVEDIMKYLLGDNTTNITNSDIATIENPNNSLPVSVTKTFYMLWRNVYVLSSGNNYFNYSVNVPGTGNTTISFPGNIFTNKHKLDTSNSYGYVNYNTERRAEGSGTATKYDWYEMYITSMFDEVKLNYTNTSSGGTIVFGVDYYFGSNSSNPSHITLSNTSGSGVSIFENVDLQTNETLHFKIYITATSTTSYSSTYSITSVNKIVSYEDPGITTMEIGDYDPNDFETTHHQYTTSNVYFIDSSDGVPIIEDDINPVATSTITYDVLFDNTESSNYTDNGNKSYNTVAIFTISSQDRNSNGKLCINSDDSSLKYIVIPARYSYDYIDNDTPTIYDIGSSCDSSNFFTSSSSNKFLNYPNNLFKANGLSWNTVGNKPMYNIDFTNAAISEDDNYYYFTVILLKDTLSYNSFGVHVDYWPNVEFVWDTNNNIRSTTNYSSTYLIDKFTVNTTDRSRIGDVPYTKRKAKNKDTSITDGAKNYTDVLDSDKPYLILSVSELATISQMVSDGIACTEIIAAVGDKHASGVFQATNDGSQIYLNANEIGIESDYFHLNNDGLKLTGNLLAKNSSGQITAGVIGDSSSNNKGVKFFAGTTLDENNISDYTIKQNAKFYVEEDGTLHAKDADISGDINAKTFSASTSYSKTIDGTNYSVSKTAIMNANTFEITSVATESGASTPETAKIYIQVMDSIEVEDGDMYIDDNITELRNVPTLCMLYGGKHYYLTPGLWKAVEQSSQPVSYERVTLYPLDGQYTYSGSYGDEGFQICWDVWIPESETGGSAIWLSKQSWMYIAGPNNPGTGASCRWGQKFGDTRVDMPESLQNRTITVKYALFTSHGPDHIGSVSVFIPSKGAVAQDMTVQMPGITD